MARRILGALALLGLAQCPAPAFAQGAAASSPITAALYGGRLLTLNQDQAGTLSRGQDLFALRLVLVAPGPGGLRIGFRGDLTSLGTIDPNNLDLKSMRTAEGYGALSWAKPFAGFDVGPALMAGGLVPIENAVTWRLQTAYAGGARIGRGQSWAYALVGRDGAADVACSCSGARAIVVGSLEVWRVALQGEYVSGMGGRKRLGAMVRLPLPK